MWKRCLNIWYHCCCNNILKHVIMSHVQSACMAVAIVTGNCACTSHVKFYQL